MFDDLMWDFTLWCMNLHGNQGYDYSETLNWSQN